MVSTQPTIGSNIEEISQNNVKFQAWDLGGQENMRTVWDAYYLNTDVNNLFMSKICYAWMLFIS